MTRTSDELVTAVQLTCMVPTNQADITPDRILQLANEEIEGKILPTLKSVNQEYLVKLYSVAIVAGTASYTIPYRFLGRTVRELKLYDGTQYRNLAKIKMEDSNLYNYQSTPTGFYFMGDQVVLLPMPITASGMSLKFWGLQRPGRLTATTNCGQVTAVDATAGTVNVSQVPSGITTGTVVDLIQGQSGNSTWAEDVTVTGIAGTTISFGAGNVPATVVVGDWVCPQWTSAVLQFPEEAFSLIQTLTSIRVLLSVGDIEGAQALAALVGDKTRQFEMMIEPRIEGENEKIINRNGLLRGNRTRLRRGLL